MSKQAEESSFAVSDTTGITTERRKVENRERKISDF